MYIQETSIYSAIGTTALDVFCSLETRLLDPAVANKTIVLPNQETTSYYEHKIAELSDLNNIQHIEKMLHEILNDSVLENNVSVIWVALPDKKQARSEWFNPSIVESVIRSIHKKLAKSTIKFSQSELGLLDAIHYLENNKKIVDLIFIAIDSLTDAVTVHQRAQQHALLTTRYHQGHALGEAACCLTLSKTHKKNSIKINGCVPDFSELKENNMPHYRHFISLFPPTTNTADLHYQFTKTYYPAGFSAPHERGMRLISPLTMTGDLGAANTAFAITYLIGANQFFNKSDPALIYQKTESAYFIFNLGDSNEAQ